MKETIVYLPEPSENENGHDVYAADAVHAALEAVGVKWAQETPEELKIRMMSLQIEELKGVCTDLRSRLEAERDVNAALEMTIRRMKEGQV